MIIDLDKLSDGPARIAGEEVVVVHDALDAEQKVNCCIDLTAKKSGETFYFHTKLIGTLSTQCHKCLRPTEFGVETSFDVVVQRGSTEVAGQSRSVEEDYVYLPLGEQEFCLDQHIYENLMVNMPMRIVCSEDCKGLCPSCGANLNEINCSCDVVDDPRWEELKSFDKKHPKS